MPVLSLMLLLVTCLASSNSVLFSFDNDWNVWCFIIGISYRGVWLRVPHEGEVLKSFESTRSATGARTGRLLERLSANKC